MEEIFGRIFLVGLLVGFFRRTIGRIFWEELFVYIGIDLFVKTLVFVKILSKSQEGGRKNLDP